MRIRITLLLLYFTCCFLQVNADERFKRGLFFKSFEVDKDKRTYLNLTPDKSLDLSKGFIVEFDLNLRNEVQNFGYVFRLICNDTLNIDLLSNIASSEAKFSLVIGHQSLVKYPNSEINFPEKTWIKVRIRCNPATNEIDLSLNGIEKTIRYPIDKLKHFRIYFGGNSHYIFSTTDIAPMTIRDIRIFDITSNLLRYWKLELHAHNAVYDECENAKAVVFNPQWEIDSHTNWSKRTSLVLPGANYCMTFDPVNDRIFIVKDKNIYIYHTRNRTMDTIEVSQGVPYNTEFSQLEYNPVKDELISYRFEMNHLATFNFQSLKWNNEDQTIGLLRYGHHSNCYIADDSLLITFGGYGYHRYNSILYKYNPVTGIWENYNLSSAIEPRYLGSMGYLGDKEILYFGGYGNESGRQEESPKNYYDLFSINTDETTVKKIWELPNPEEHFTNSNSLVINKNNRKFYALAYSNKRYTSVIRLHEYNLDKPEYRTVGDSIPYFFSDVESFCDLFQSSDSTELYAITSSVRNNFSEISIYSIAFPTLSTEEIIQHLQSQSNVWVWLWLVIPAGFIVVFILFRKRRYRRKLTDSAEIEQIFDNKEKPILFKSLSLEKKHSSIHLLGNIRIMDSNSLDITKNFTPTTTQLFLLLLISTINNGQGVTSQELRKLLWFDKDDESARNNRNVYINKLRSILKSFEEIRIINNEGYWTVQSEKTVFCDYERVLLLIQSLKTGNQFNKKLLADLVDIASKGTLLPYIQQSEWIEPYQSDYANRLIECLMENSKRDEVKADLILLLKIAEAILLHDNIDEDAINLKCYALFRLGRRNQALQVFNKFTSDYEILLAAKHNLTFEEMIKLK